MSKSTRPLRCPISRLVDLHIAPAGHHDPFGLGGKTTPILVDPWGEAFDEASDSVKDIWKTEMTELESCTRRKHRC